MKNLSSALLSLSVVNSFSSENFLLITLKSERVAIRFTSQELQHTRFFL